MSNDLLKCKYTATHGTGAANYGTSSPCTWLDWYDYSNSDHVQHRRKCSCGSKATGWGYSYENHTYGEWTYANESSRKRTCACGHEQAVAHGIGSNDLGTAQKGEYGAWADYNDAQHRRQCACGHYDYQDHQWVSQGTVAPTCTSQGYTNYKCSVCGHTTTGDYTDATGHSWGDPYDGTYHKCKNGCGATQAHSWTATGTVAPTCTSQGYTNYKCDACGETTTGSYTAALGHDMGGWYTTVNPTCTDLGTQRRDCSRSCGYYEEQSIAATGHSWGDPYDGTYHKCKNGCGATQAHTWTATGTVAATCTSQGYTNYKCNVCGATTTSDYNGPNGHSWGDWYRVTDPTCTNTGTDRRNCNNCSAYETRDVAATGHSWGTYHDGTYHKCNNGCGELQAHTWTATGTVAATCTSQGYTNYKCNVCGATTTSDYNGPNGHSWGGWYRVTDPTCTTTGTDRRNCNNCSAYETREVAATGHTVVAIPAVSPTCTSNGSTAGTKCSVCGVVFTAPETVPAPGHNWIPNNATNHICTRCSATESHQFGSWIVDRSPTCGTAGHQYRTCSVCSYQEEASIPATGSHDWYVSSSTAATCTTGGSTTYTCRVCGATKTETTQPTGHSWGSWYYADETFHERTCNNCGTTENGQHSWSTGTIDFPYRTATCSTCGGSQSKVVMPSGLYDASYNMVASWADMEAAGFYPGCAMDEFKYGVMYQTWPSAVHMIIDNSVTSIDGGWFLADTRFISVYIPPSVTQMGTHTFEESSIQRVYGMEGITEISYSSFSYCEKLTYIELPRVISIIEGSMDHCYSLTSITLPSTLRFIGYHAFDGTPLSTAYFDYDDLFDESYQKWYACNSATSTSGEQIWGIESGGVLAGYLTDAYVGKYWIYGVGTGDSGEQKTDDEEHVCSWTVIGGTSATCTSDGTVIKSCSCGKQITTLVTATGHEWTTTGTVAATCTTEGYTQVQCTKCGATEKQNVVNALGHSYSTKSYGATCTRDAYKVTTCSTCGHSITTTSPGTMRDHEFRSYTDNGDGTHTCHCGDCTYTTVKAHMELTTTTDTTTEIYCGYCDYHYYHDRAGVYDVDGNQIMPWDEINRYGLDDDLYDYYDPSWTPGEYLHGKTYEIVFSSTISKIGAGIFYNARYMPRVIEIADEITSVGQYAFYGSGDLESLDLGRVTYIGEYAFRAPDINYKLQELTIPYDCTYIGRYAFYGHTSVAVDFMNCTGWSVHGEINGYSQVRDLLAGDLADDDIAAMYLTWYNSNGVKLGPTYYHCYWVRE